MTSLTSTLNRIKALAEKATPGPWEHDINGYIAPIKDGEYGETVAITRPFVGRISKQAKVDADFIAASRELVPRLVAALEESLRQNEILSLGKSRENYKQRLDKILRILQNG